MLNSENYSLKASGVSVLHQLGRFRRPNGGYGVSDAKGKQRNHVTAVKCRKIKTKPLLTN